MKPTKTERDAARVYQWLVSACELNPMPHAIPLLYALNPIPVFVGTGGCSGVYILFHHGVPVYVGQSINVGGRLASHAIDKVYDSAYMVAAGEDDLNALEAILIAAFRCPRNHQTGSVFVVHGEARRAREYRVPSIQCRPVGIEIGRHGWWGAPKGLLDRFQPLGDFEPEIKASLCARDIGWGDAVANRLPFPAPSFVRKVIFPRGKTVVFEKSSVRATGAAAPSRLREPQDHGSP